MQKIPFFARIDAAVVAVMALMLTCVLWDTWSTRLDYAFGYLMPVFMLYVIWDRLPKIEKYFLGKPSQNKGGLLAAGTTFLFGGMAVCGFAGFFRRLLNRARNYGAVVWHVVLLRIRVLWIGVFCGGKKSRRARYVLLR